MRQEQKLMVGIDQFTLKIYCNTWGQFWGCFGMAFVLQNYPKLSQTISKWNRIQNICLFLIFAPS